MALSVKTYSILYYSSVFFLIGGAALLVPGILAITMDGSLRLALIFFGSGAMSLFIGLMVKFLLPEPERLGFDAALGIAALGWLFLAVIGSLPFILAWDPTAQMNPGLPVLDALFESMSGFTATGLTLYSSVEGLPASILFWRSLTQWIGGVGVIVLFLSILIRGSSIAGKLYRAEGRSDKIAPTVASTARRIWGIYILYTLLCILGLMILSLDPFAAINLSMTAMASGGFAITDASIGSYNWAIGVFLIPFMVIAGISFVCHRKLLTGDIKGFFGIEVVAMISISVVFAIFLMMHNHGAYDSFFQVFSAITGTGFSTTSLAAWNDFSKFLLSILMVMGGGYGSTSSALKMIRVIILIFAMVWVVRKNLYGRNARVPFTIGKRVYPEKEVKDVVIYTLLYLIVLVAGSLVFMAGGHSAADSIFEVSSAEGNVGLSVGITTPMMPWWEKVVLFIEMWVGRLEIFPVLILLAIPFRRFR